MSDGRTPILYIAPWVDLGGSDRGTIDWFKNIDRSRWAPSLITTTPSPNRWLHHIEPYAEEIWDLPDNDAPLYDGPKFTPEEVAEGIVAALGVEGFGHYVPDMKAAVDFKNADIDTYIAGAASMGNAQS